MIGKICLCGDKTNFEKNFPKICCISRRDSRKSGKRVLNYKKNCNTEECCNSCDFQFYSGDLESDAVSADGDKADGSVSPATGSESSSEKEESKSDGCSMLFI